MSNVNGSRRIITVPCHGKRLPPKRCAYFLVIVFLHMVIDELTELILYNSIAVGTDGEHRIEGLCKVQLWPRTMNRNTVRFKLRKQLQNCQSLNSTQRQTNRRTTNEKEPLPDKYLSVENFS